MERSLVHATLGVAGRPAASWCRHRACRPTVIWDLDGVVDVQRAARLDLDIMLSTTPIRTRNMLKMMDPRCADTVAGAFGDDTSEAEQIKILAEMAGEDSDYSKEDYKDDAQLLGGDGDDGDDDDDEDKDYKDEDDEDNDDADDDDADDEDDGDGAGNARRLRR